jgi:hypothetical protein
MIDVGIRKDIILQAPLRCSADDHYGRQLITLIDGRKDKEENGEHRSDLGSFFFFYFLLLSYFFTFTFTVDCVRPLRLTGLAAQQLVTESESLTRRTR